MPAHAGEEHPNTEIQLMFSGVWTRYKSVILLSAIAITLSGVPIAARAARQPVSPPDHPVAASLHWESSARMHRAAFAPSNHGTLLIDGNGVEFRGENKRSQRWAVSEIQTAFIAPHRLVLKTYLNRSLHRPGERKYRFSLAQAVPPAVAAQLAGAVARPSQNADPDPDAPAIATIPVRHRAIASGTNGVLRIRQDGIDYVTSSKDDSRSWRWADLQTLSSPDPYHLFVFGYRDTYTFNLKAPLSSKLLDRASDEIFAHSESVNGPAVTTLHETEPGAAGGRHE